MHISINGCKIFFDVYGSKLKVLPDRVVEKPTLIVLHGGHGLADHTIYVEFWTQFSDIAQVILIDQRGCGRSDPRDSSEWNLRQWSEDLYAFCNTLEIHKPIIAGVSMGGHVMCDYIRHHPGHAGGLIFCNTEAHVILEDICTEMVKHGGVEAGEAARDFYSNSSPASMKRYIELCVPLYAHNAYSPQELARCQKHFAVFEHFFKNEILRFNYLQDLQTINCPTLLMAGEDSTAHPFPWAFAMLEQIPEELGHIHVFKKAGAPVYKDSPEESAEVARNFILNVAKTS